MNATKLYVLGLCVCVVVAFVCITYAAMYFHKPSILWWYLVPLCMSSIEVKSGPNNDKKE